MKVVSFIKLIALVAVTSLLFVSSAMAYTSDAKDARTYFNSEGIQGIPLQNDRDTCALCHFEWDGGDGLNKYGRDFDDAGRDIAAFAEIEDFDSDGDGSSNLEELKGGFLPGNDCDTNDNDISGVPNNVVLADILGPTCNITDVPQNIVVNPGSYDFGLVDVGNMETATITISNDGDLALNVTAITLDSNSSSEFSIQNFPAVFPLFTLESNEEVDVEVKYTPLNGGSDMGSLHIESNDPDEPQVSVILAGMGRVIPQDVCSLEVDTLSINFGSIETGQTAEVSVSINNNGVVDCTIENFNFTGSSDFALGLSSPVTPLALQAGESLDVPIVYTPGEVGNDNGEFDIESTDPNQPVIMVGLKGSGFTPGNDDDDSGDDDDSEDSDSGDDDDSGDSDSGDDDDSEDSDSGDDDDSGDSDSGDDDDSGDSDSGDSDSWDDDDSGDSNSWDDDSGDDKKKKKKKKKRRNRRG